MQTFLPYDDFKFSAQCLDNKRVGKQRVEAWQILNALRGLSKGWVNHPATVMWRGYEQALIHYGMVMSAEWQERGFNDNMYERFRAELETLDYDMPWWFGYSQFHITHKSNLYRKDPVYYSEFADIGGDLPYMWCHESREYHLGTDKHTYIPFNDLHIDKTIYSSNHGQGAQ